MPLPADFNTVRVFGTYVDAGGNPLPNSKVTFTATERLHSTAYSTVIVPSSIEAVPDSSGHIDIELPCTDDPDIEPVGGWAWQVEEKFGTYIRRYEMLAPQGDAVDLTNVQPAVPPGAAPVNVLETVVGKHANAEGDIPIYLGELADSGITSPSAGQLLEYDGTHWTNAIPPHGLGDLIAANNLSDVANVPTARANLGLRGASLLDVGTLAGTVAAGDDSRIAGAAQKANNLADLTNIVNARTALGLGGAALLGVGTAAGTVAAGDDSRITGAAQKANNLSDLASVSTARANLGLGGAALLNVGTTTGTVPDAADSRITVTQDATKGNNALNTRVSALETKPHARYVNTGQPTLTAGDNQLAFPTARNTDPNVTANGSNNSWTLAAGLWIIETGWRTGSDNVKVELDLVAAATFGTGTATLTNLGIQGRAPWAAAIVRLASATAFMVNLWNGTGASLGTAPAFGDANHISFTRLSA